MLTLRQATLLLHLWDKDPEFVHYYRIGRDIDFLLNKKLICEDPLMKGYYGLTILGKDLIPGLLISQKEAA
jgi:hypothetical protein